MQCILQVNQDQEQELEMKQEQKQEQEQEQDWFKYSTKMQPPAPTSPVCEVTSTNSTSDLQTQLWTHKNCNLQLGAVQ